MNERMNMNLNHKLLVTIVKKGFASKVVKSSKEAGAKGGTIVYGRGTGRHEKKKFFGIPVEPEKEIILTLVPEGKMDVIVSAVEKAGKLEKPGYGIGFIVDVSQVAGMAHLSKFPIQTVPKEVHMSGSIQYDLIVTIVNKGYSEEVVEAAKKAGAEGGTIIYGRGTGIHEQAKILNIAIEPEKELILTLIDREKTEAVLESIMVEAELNKPGKGIAFILEVERTTGINHVLNRMVKQRLDEDNVEE